MFAFKFGNNFVIGGTRMQCRRCKQEYAPDSDDLEADAPHVICYELGIGLNTVVCLGCHDDWYVLFSQKLAEYYTLSDAVDSILQGNMSVLPHMGLPLLPLMEKRNALIAKINVQTILWTRQGTDSNVYPDD